MSSAPARLFAIFVAMILTMALFRACASPASAQDRRRVPALLDDGPLRTWAKCAGLALGRPVDVEWAATADGHVGGVVRAAGRVVGSIRTLSPLSALLSLGPVKGQCAIVVEQQRMLLQWTKKS